MFIVTADNLVLMYGEAAPSIEPGQQLVELDEAQTIAFKDVRAQPNSGLTFDGVTFGTIPLDTSGIDGNGKALEERRADGLAEGGTLEDRLAALELRLKIFGG